MRGKKRGREREREREDFHESALAIFLCAGTIVFARQSPLLLADSVGVSTETR